MSKSPNRKRLDKLLSEQHPELSRSRIQAEIMAGNVLVNGINCDKPGTLLSIDSIIAIKQVKNPYVSRGGLKLAGALDDLSIAVNNKVVLDVGASTGGFTDCLIQNGARLVYALDVGSGQLAWKLRQHPQVVVIENKNIRNLKPDDLPEIPDLTVIDVSFISLRLVLPVIRNLGVTAVLSLVKPQFEIGRVEASKGRGVIRDPELHRQVLFNLVNHACDLEYCCIKLFYSRLIGPKGNIEYFTLFERREAGKCKCADNIRVLIDSTVDRAWQQLSGSQ